MNIVCVIPTHRRPHLVGRALRSVLEQTVQPAVIVVSDDASDPETAELVRQRSRGTDVSVEYRPHFGGPGTAGYSRNAAAEGTEAEAIAFLDDDDMWEPTFLEKTSSLLTPETDFVVAWTDHIVEQRRFRGNRMRSYLSAEECLFPNPGLTGSNVLYRSTTFRGVGGFDPQLVVANDLDLLVRLLMCRAQYAVLPEVLVSQITHSGTHLTTRGERRAKGLEGYAEKYRKELSRAQWRDIQRLVHSARRGADQPWSKRAYHLAAQVYFTSPERWTQGIQRRISGKPDMYNGVSFSVD